MRSPVILLAVILVFCNASGYGRGVLNELDTFKTGKLVGLLESVRGIVKNGNSSLNIPPLDPLTLRIYPLDLARDGLYQFKVYLEHVKVDGLSTYIIEEGDFKIIGLKVVVALNWPEISANLDYDGSGNLGDSLNVFGKGHIAAVVKDVNFSINLKLVVRNERLNAKDVDVKISLGSLDLNITGLYNDEELSVLLSKIISEITPQLLDDYQAEVMGVVNKLVTDVLNNYLVTMSLSDLLGLIG